MKICFFTSGVFPVRKDSVKATEFWTYKLAEKLSSLGHEIHIFGAKGSKGNFTLHTPKWGIIPYAHLAKKSNYYSYLTSFFAECIQYVNKNGFDLIHDQTSAPYVLSIVGFSKVPVVSTLHVLRDSDDYKLFYKDLENVYFVAPSAALKKASKNLTIRYVIPHGIDFAGSTFVDYRGNNFSCIGRLFESKGHLDAVKAAEIAQKNLLVAGYATENEASVSYAKQVELTAKKSKYSEFIGKVERNKVAHFMGNSVALLMPMKETEAFGLVMVEANSCGTPVITYDIGTAREIIKDGVNGIIVERGDIGALAKAMADVSKIDREKCREYAKGKFSLDQMVNRYIKVYNKVKKS